MSQFKVGDKVIVTVGTFDMGDRIELGKTGTITEIVKTTKINMGRCIKVTFPKGTFPGYDKSSHTCPYKEDEIKLLTPLGELL